MSASAWAAMWHSRNRLDGVTEHLVYTHGVIALFATRKQAREFIDREYGYIRARPDLRAEPHGWRIPKPARVTVEPAR